MADGRGWKNTDELNASARYSEPYTVPLMVIGEPEDCHGRACSVMSAVAVGYAKPRMAMMESASRNDLSIVLAFILPHHPCHRKKNVDKLDEYEGNYYAAKPVEKQVSLQKV